MTGDYVAFPDSDDAFFPETIEKSVNAILTYDTDCAVFKRAVCKTLKNGKMKMKPLEKIFPVMKEGVYSREEVLNAVINKNLNIAVWNKVYKRYIRDNLRFSQGLVYEDLDIILPVLYRTQKIYVSDEILIMYRLRSGSITNEISLKNTEDF